MANPTDTKATTTSPDTNKPKSDTITCDLFNPTRANRVIYDGIPGSMKQITVNRGETKHDVTISNLIADELRERCKTKKDSDLIVIFNKISTAA